MKNNTADPTDETMIIEAPVVEEAGNAGCQVRRKIEDHLERRRYKDELGTEDLLLEE